MFISPNFFKGLLFKKPENVTKLSLFFLAYLAALMIFFDFPLLLIKIIKKIEEQDQV